MDVSILTPRVEPLIADTVADYATGRRVGLLILGAPGMGKTALLRSALHKMVAPSSAASAWISGSIVASEGHFFELLADALNVRISHYRAWKEGAAEIASHLRNTSQFASQIVLAIDDLDDLAFKREGLLKELASIFRATPRLSLLATCRPAARQRIIGQARPLASAFRVGAVSPLTREQALELIRRRAPLLDNRTARSVVTAAGGHPGALVFLSRLAELRTPNPAGEDLSTLLDSSAELAGAVYAEPWAALGPQQRAILWQLAAYRDTAASKRVADALVLPHSHVNAQLARLTDEALIQRVGRGRFTLSPLLARWILKRAAPGTDGATNQILVSEI